MSLIPTALMIGFFLYLFRTNAAAGGRGGRRGGIFGFGESTAKIIKEDVGIRFK